MISVIRISGMVDVNKDIENTMYRLRLRRKYSCVVLRENKELKGMLEKIRNFVAYGKIDDETLKQLIEKRGQLLQKAAKENRLKSDKGKINAESIAKMIKNTKPDIKIDYKKLGIKPFFRLHPPRGGIKSKKHYPKGVLGDNKEKINELIRRML